MRNAFADEATKMSIADSRIVLLSGDIGNKLFDTCFDNGSAGLRANRIDHDFNIFEPDRLKKPVT